MKDDADKEADVFESQFVMHFPHHSEEVPFSKTQEFSFTKPLWRMVVQRLVLPGFFGPGTLRLEHRIRPKGQNDWTLRQSYPVILEEARGPAKTAEKRSESQPIPSSD